MSAPPETPSSNVTKNLKSSLGQKYIMGVSGLALVGFIITHLAGNLTLLDPTGDAFNRYAKSLHDFGNLALAAEFGLLGLFLLHIYMAIKLTANYKAARPEKYAVYKSKGGPTKSNLGSRNMIVTGLVLLVFLIIHVRQMRFGAHYPTEIEGEEARDLYRLVVEVFADPLNVALYVGVMIFLGFHLRHGFWSMFQSLGFMFPRYSKFIYTFALLFAVLMAVGFIILPIYIYVGASA